MTTYKSVAAIFFILFNILHGCRKVLYLEMKQYLALQNYYDS